MANHKRSNTIVTTMRLDKDVLRAAGKAAVRQGVSRTFWTEQCMRRSLRMAASEPKQMFEPDTTESSDGIFD